MRQQIVQPLSGLFGPGRELVRARTEFDLTPIAEHSVPREVVPLIQAINLHTDRQKKLGEAQKRFIASAPHQLKTPLTVLRAQAAHAMQLDELERMREAVGQRHDATHATSRLVQQLLTLARSEPGHTLEIEDFALTELARDVTSGLSTLALGKSIDLGFEGEAAVQVRGERLLLGEMVANRVHNAINYAPFGGRATVAVWRAQGRPTLSVDDSSPGIAPARRARVLDPFYRLPRPHAEGSGLGLAIVKEICDRHGLTIVLEDVPAKAGLRARVSWPEGRSTVASGRRAQP